MINRLHQNCLGRASTRFVDGVDVQRTYLVAIAVNGYLESMAALPYSVTSTTQRNPIVPHRSNPGQLSRNFAA